MKIKNEKHIAILGIPFTADTMSGKHTYAKGHKALVQGMFEHGGEYIVEGHGIGHIIPRANFTKFVWSWDEVTVTVKNGVKTVKTKHKTIDDTAETLAWFARLDANKTKKANVWKRGVVRSKIADLRKAIKDVQSGKAVQELTKLLAELETLK